MNNKPVCSSGISRTSLIKENGLWVHQGVPDRPGDWLDVIDQVREERTLAVLGRSEDEPG